MIYDLRFTVCARVLLVVLVFTLHTSHFTLLAQPTNPIASIPANLRPLSVTSNAVLFGIGTNIFWTNINLIRNAGIVAPTNSAVDGYVPIATGNRVKWISPSAAGFQTPWLSAIDAAQFSLANAGSVTAGIITSTGAVWAANSTAGIQTNGVFFSNPAGTSSNNFVGGDMRHSLGTGARGASVTGWSNTVAATNWPVVAGASNLISDARSTASAILSGQSNTLAGVSPYSTISGGSNNVIHAGTSGGLLTFNGFNFIGGGQANYIGYFSTNSGYVGNCVIVGGWGNRIFDNGQDYSFIGGGYGNTINDAIGVISGGYENSISAPVTGFIANGGFIGGGTLNSISATGQNADYSVIAGGYGNLVRAQYSQAAGRNAIATNHNTYIWNSASTNISTASTNQYILNAVSVGINTNNPGTNALKVVGNIDSTVGFSINGVPLAVGGGGGAGGGGVFTNIEVWATGGNSAIYLVSDSIYFATFHPTNTIFDAPITFANDVRFPKLAWSGPTNTLSLANKYYHYATSTDISITGLGQTTATYAQWTVLRITNAAATSKTLYIPAQWTTDDGQRSYTMTNAQVSILSIGNYGNDMTNAVFRPFY